jgi:hypothetical protein
MIVDIIGNLLCTEDDFNIELLISKGVFTFLSSLLEYYQIDATYSYSRKFEVSIMRAISNLAISA